MNLTKEIEKVFSGAQEITEIEQDTLVDCLQWMRDDVENGMPVEVIHAWNLKIQGIVEYLDVCGKIVRRQSEQILKILNEITGESYE